MESCIIVIGSIAHLTFPIWRHLSIIVLIHDLVAFIINFDSHFELPALKNGGPRHEPVDAGLMARQAPLALVMGLIHFSRSQDLFILALH
jgi:hypothetical protein